MKSFFTFAYLAAVAIAMPAPQANCTSSSIIPTPPKPTSSTSSKNTTPTSSEGAAITPYKNTIITPHKNATATSSKNSTITSSKNTTTLSSACAGNTADDRAKWCEESIDTDWYNFVPNTGVTREVRSQDTKANSILTLVYSTGSTSPT